jgi:hypothetical protein
LPGELYGADDAAVFNDLEATVRDARPTPGNAAELLRQLDSRATNPGRGLKRLGRLLPSLAVLELIVENNPAAMRKAEGMLALLLQVVASKQRQSTLATSLYRPERSLLDEDD